MPYPTAHMPRYGMPMPIPMAHASPGNRHSSFTLKNIFINLCIITVLVFVNKAGVPGNLFFFGVLAVLALKSPEWALKAFSLVMLALITNAYFVEKNGLIWLPGRFGILFLTAGRFFYELQRARHSIFRRRYFIFFLLYLVVVTGLSFINQYFLVVSLLKILAFGVGAAAIMAGSETLRLKNSELTCWFFSMILFTICLGILAMLIGQGYNAKGFTVSFFNGPFYHSNTLGPLSAMMAVYLIALYLFAPYPHRWLQLIMILIMVYFAYLTQSRTALASIVIGGGALLFMAFTSSRRGGRIVRMNLPKVQIVLYMLAAGVLAVVGDIATGGSISSRVVELVNKGTSKAYGATSGGFDMEQILASRRAKYDLQLANFEANKLTGISFGTSTEPHFLANATFLTAPTEKGNLAIAVLEETGLIGTFFFVLFIGSFIWFLFRDLNISGFGVFITFIAVNMGEMMFFSLGAHGGFAWVLVGAAISLGDRCSTSQVGPPQARF